MRPNSSNKRLRGRNRNKSSNPLARSYESNGPDVKIRGSALQVADKYAQLARDAQSAGDRVMAENYFQHAEHYYRIVAQAYEQTNGQQARDRRDEQRHDDRDDSRDDHDNREETNREDDNARVEARGEGEQPYVNGHDAVDEDDGLRRTLRTNGNGQAGTQEGGTAESESPSAEAPQAEASPDAPEEPKPKRRPRATRSRTRTRRTETGDGTQNESTEPAS